MSSDVGVSYHAQDNSPPRHLAHIPLILTQEDLRGVGRGEPIRIRRRKGELITTINPKLDNQGRPFWYEVE